MTLETAAGIKLRGCGPRIGGPSGSGGLLCGASTRDVLPNWPMSAQVYGKWKNLH